MHFQKPARSSSNLGVLWIGFSLMVSCAFAQEIPEIELLTFYGGSRTDDCDSIALDDEGNMYLGCHSNSLDLPGNAEFPYTIVGDMDGFVVKLDASGESVEYITHLGGTGWDAVLDLAVDRLGNVYAVGGTYSNDFPVSGKAEQASFGGVMDVFLAKIDPQGEILWSRYFGGSGEEESSDLFLDDQGNVSIVGYTESSDLQTSIDSVQAESGGQTDAFVAHFDPLGRLVYSTYLGGSGDDFGSGIELNASGKVHISGTTNSSDFPVTNAINPNLIGSTDAFAAVIDASGSMLEFSSFLGGSGGDQGLGIGLGQSGDVIILGGTTSSDLSVLNAAQTELAGSSDVFVARIDTEGSRLIYLTYLGGSGRERARKMVVDTAGRAIVVGQTSSADFPFTKDGRSGLSAEDDGFITMLAPLGSTFSYSLLSGGASQDTFEGVAIVADDSLVVSGASNSTDLPKVSPLQDDFLGGRFDAIVVKLRLDLIP